ncbi:hypothetical protein [Streptomyces chryseus]|uniref:Uncharacterized protein n=1 Tax=Streptomyces chryseus TaxID=68186 RepID=A0ABQ3DGY2_9ACTN|nr:hypothetical protein [Streptomyces chryseus]GHA94364.1 hypothetical protein GCM10010346_16410 [Streptomyces chryseus]
MQTLTFPSGTTVDLPQGMTVCQSPETVTYDCARVVPVGTTPAGRSVFTSFSCAAYSRAADVLDQRREVAERERYVQLAASKGRRTDRLEEYRDHHRRVLDRTLAEYASDPAPCTCA